MVSRLWSSRKIVDVRSLMLKEGKVKLGNERGATTRDSFVAFTL